MSEDPMTTDQQPTQWIPVAREDETEDPFVEGGWAQPKRRSRITVGLVAALLVAIGFLLGVTVEKFAASVPRERATTTTTQPATPPRTATP